MVDQYKKQTELGFEGRADQLGNPQGAWDVNGNPVDLESRFASLLNETSEQTEKSPLDSMPLATVPAN